jgi:class 3 adenylate cyclase
MNDFVIAQSYLDKSIQLGKELPNKQILQECFRLQSEIFESTRKYKQSIKYFRQYNSIKEEVQTEKSLQKAVLFDEKRKIELEDKQREVKFARLQEQEKLLHNILPINIADRILQNETFIADYYESVSVLFMDLVEFTPLSSIAPPKQLVYILDTIFTKADEIVELFGLEKIKTIGDGYMAVANVTKALEHHQKATALAAIELQKTLKDFEVVVSKDLGDIEWIKNHKIIEIRIGIHTGEVVAGVIGKHKYTYDLWGDAVNVASRMESNSEAGQIHVSEEFAKSISEYPEFKLIPRGEIFVKGKGTMNTYWLEKAI